MSVRLASLDIARGVAIVAMIVFHFVWDLGNFGYIDAGVPYSAPVKLFGHAIAIVFLFIVGVSLALAQSKGRRPFWVRVARIAGAATLVSLGTYLIFPQAYVFFGILHCIAAASVLALPLLGRPWPAALFIGALAIVAPLVLRSAAFDAPLLSFIGLSTIEWPTNDYRPLLPWAGYVFIGVAAAKFWRTQSLAPLGADWSIPPLAFLGRHSLPVYLVHQPVLFGLFYGVAALGATPVPIDQDAFAKGCEAACAEKLDASYCRKQCACISEGLSSFSIAELIDSEKRERRIRDLAQSCADEHY